MTLNWGVFHPESLLGANDPYQLSPLLPGETIIYCENCNLGFHATTVEFLRAQNGGRCSACNVPNRWRTYTLPGGSAVKTPEGVDTPAAAGTLVKLDRIWEHVGQFVTFEGYVHQVYQSRSSGTWFVKFEDTRSPLAGFRLVIYNGYTKAWTSEGLDIKTYEGATLRVRGLIRNDPAWGIQMLIDRPEVISIVDDGKHNPDPGSHSDNEDDDDDAGFPLDPDGDGPPSQRIIWKV